MQYEKGTNNQEMNKAKLCLVQRTLHVSTGCHTTIIIEEMLHHIKEITLTHTFKTNGCKIHHSKFIAFF